MIQDIKRHNIVELSNGLLVAINGFEKEPLTEDSLVFVMTSPVSSLVSRCYPEHIIRVIEKIDSFEDEMNWWYNNIEIVKNQPLHIALEKESAKKMIDLNDLKTYDIVELSNSMFGTVQRYSDEPLTEDSMIFLLTSSRSFILSRCYPEHVVRVVKKIETVDEWMEWWWENVERDRPQPFYVFLDKGKNMHTETSEKKRRVSEVKRLMDELLRDFVPCFYWDHPDYKEMYYNYNPETDSFDSDCGISLKIEASTDDLTKQNIWLTIDDLRRKIDKYFYEVKKIDLIDEL